ncbi:MAG: glycoside hydrolase family 18 protein [Planctomycetales bacterium]|nr:glycoside hydrolase family 18 protein [Planctomycetales bacterium]
MPASIHFFRQHQSLRLVLGAVMLLALLCSSTRAQQDSVSTWEAAEFRSWSFIPYWTTQSQLESFDTDGIYDHVSDVLYFSGVRPTASGGLNYHPWAAQHLATLASHQASNGFRYHMSMFDTYGGDVETVWNSITSNPTNRANFVANVTSLLQANGMTGFNLDWERPNTVTEWANYTQLAKDLKAAIGPLGMEVSVDDYGYTDSKWDDSSVFDANTYDQLFIMGYHYPAYSANTLNHNYFANGKLALTGQGVEKAFQDEQLVLGIGTWGKDAGTKSLKSIVEADPNLAYDATTWTDGVDTWTIESREQVRGKVQLALDRNMAGVMYWTLHYDSPTQLGLHRVAHHYVSVARDIPDLNLDGKVDAADADALADNMGSSPGSANLNTAAGFDQFYLQSNWEQGDHDGSGFVNQADADWLADRFATLGVNLSDRLAYNGTFENFQNGPGLVGRWQVPLNGGSLPETSNFAQHGSGQFGFAGSGAGYDKHSDASVTIRNQNAAEASDTLNTDPREMGVALSAPINLGQDVERYFTFLVRQNTGSLLPSQLASDDRDLFLNFQDAAGADQFNIALSGLSGEVAINSLADPSGDDVSFAGFFLPDTTYLFVGKISGNGGGANQLQLSFFPEGSSVGDFTGASFPWLLTANSSVGFDPVVTDLQLVSLYEANYTISNIQIGAASHFFGPPLEGDFDADGDVDGFDFLKWQRGETFDPLGMLDLGAWESGFGSPPPLAAAPVAVPEPSAAVLLTLLAAVGVFTRPSFQRFSVSSVYSGMKSY